MTVQNVIGVVILTLLGVAFLYGSWKAWAAWRTTRREQRRLVQEGAERKAARKTAEIVRNELRRFHHFHGVRVRNEAEGVGWEPMRHIL